MTAVVCPFGGTVEDGLETLGRLARISLGEGDSVILVDNTRDHVLASLDAEARRGARIVSAAELQSSYYARNVGAELVDDEWILFVDSDCVPVPEILEEYFAEPPPEACGAVAGGVTGADQPGLLGRYARARGILDQERFTSSERPFAATANLLVRRRAWEAVGGFCEGIRSGGDVDFCWRLRDAGWTMAFRPSARVEHLHRETLSGLVEQYARYGAGRAWLQRRHPDAPQASRHLRLLAASPFLLLGLALAGRREQLAYRALDILIVVANLSGRLRGNRARGRRLDGSAADVAVLADAFPEQSFLDACRRSDERGRSPLVDAGHRSPREPARLARGIVVSYREDDGVAEGLRDAVWLGLRRPGSVLRDLVRPRPRGVPLRRLAPTVRRLVQARVRVVVSAGAAGESAPRVARLAAADAVPLEAYLSAETV